MESNPLIDKIRIYNKKQRLIDLGTSLFFTLGIFIIAITVALFLLKSPIYGLIGILSLLFYRPRTFIERVRMLDRKINFKGELVGSLQFCLSPKSNKEGYSRELIEGFIKSVADKFSSIDINKYLTFEKFNRSILFFLLTVILFLSYPAFFPKRFYFSLNRKIEYQLLPRTMAVPKGIEIDLKLHIFNLYLPRAVELISEEGGVTKREKIFLTDGIARKKVTVEKSLTFYFRIFERKTEKIKLQVIEPLVLRHLEFHLKYPAYTHLKEEIKTTRDIVAPVGTEVLVKGIASQNLSRGLFEYGDTTELDCQDNEFTGRFTIKSSGNALLYLKAQTELKEVITIYSVSNLAPIVEIFYPGYNIYLPQDMKLTLGIKCSDDYGLEKAVLNYYLKENKKINLRINRGSIEDTIFFDWNLSSLGLLPGDEVSYYVEVTDNSGQTSRSKFYHIYFPTMEQIYEEVSGKEAQLQSDLNSLQELYKENVGEIKRMEEKIKKEKELSYLDKERLKEVIGKEEQILKKISEWQEELEKTLERLKEGIVLDQKSIERLQEITRILQEIAPEELRQALQDLKLELDKKPEEVRRALENLKELQEEFTRALERTLEILKRYQQEERLRELAEKAKELAEKSERLNERYQQGEEIKCACDTLAENIDSLAHQIEKLSQELEEVEIASALSEKATEAREMAPINPDNLSKTESDLNKLAADLQQLYESLTKGRTANLRKNMMEVLNRLIEISKIEEEILNSEKLDIDLQSALTGSTKAVAESLYAQQVKSLYVTPQMGKRLARAIKEMEQAQRDASLGMDHKDNIREAMRQLNLASIEILESLKKAMESGGSSTGMDQFLKSLSEITQGQMAMNQSMLGIFPIPVSGLSKEQMAQISRLAGRQRELREAIEALKDSPGAGKYQELLEEISREMQDIEEALYQYKLDRKLIERQQLLISRLLDAEKSIRQEDWTKERKSRPGKDVIRPSPPPLPQELGRDELNELIQRALREPYPQEYEIYIREYFRRILQER
ncbi:MAG: hypothetical protein ABIL70_00950 [candidate division WOR-3 bacterium]